MSEITISLPFSIDAYGSVSTTSDQKKIWSDRVRFVIGTNLHERLLDPNFGTLVPEAFMDTSDSAERMITTEVERAFSMQLGLLTLNRTTISYDEYTGTTNVDIQYSLPNSEVANTTVGVSYLNGSNPLVEENL